MVMMKQKARRSCRHASAFAYPIRSIEPRFNQNTVVGIKEEAKLCVVDENHFGEVAVFADDRDIFDMPCGLARVPHHSARIAVEPSRHDAHGIDTVDDLVGIVSNTGSKNYDIIPDTKRNHRRQQVQRHNQSGDLAANTTIHIPLTSRTKKVPNVRAKIHKEPRRATVDRDGKLKLARDLHRMHGPVSLSTLNIST